MKPFAYHAPTSVAQAVALLAEYGDRASIVAGGTDLLRDLRAGRRSPLVLVDIGRIRELGVIAVEGDQLVVGAAVTFAELASSQLVRTHARALAQAASAVGSPQIRNRGTVGGNLANASPAADSVPALLALGAQAVTAAAGGGRVVPVQEVLAGVHRNTLAPDEVVTGFRLPLSTGKAHSGFVKLGRRRALAIARINVAAWVEVDGGRVSSARVALGAVAPTPVLVPEAGSCLTGQETGGRALEAAVAAVVARATRELGDRASAPYKRAAIGPLTRRLLQGLLT